MTRPVVKRTVPLFTSSNTTLDSSGNGTVAMGPTVGQRWDLASAAIRVSSVNDASAPVPSVSLYMGGAAIDTFLVDGTFTGNLNSTTNVAGIPLTNGQKIFAVWTGGNPGDTATLTVTGTVSY